MAKRTARKVKRKTSRKTRKTSRTRRKTTPKSARTTRKTTKRKTVRKSTRKPTSRKAKKSTKPARSHVVKRRGHREQYDSRKVYASAYAAALNCHYTDTKAEKIASHVCKAVDKWIKNKSHVCASDVRHQIEIHIKDKHARLMYKHHHDIC